MGLGQQGENYRPLYPASNRLQSIPPRYYDVVDLETNRVVESDLQQRLNRSRSVSRNCELRDGWSHPRYSDLVVGSRAHPGHRFPRSSTEYCRDMMSASRSPSPAPQHINHYHQEMIASNEERIHHSRMKTMYPETYRGQSSVYNYQLGRYLTSHDSPSYRYYRYSSPSPLQDRLLPPRYSSRMCDPVFVPVSAPAPSLRLRRK